MKETTFYLCVWSCPQKCTLVPRIYDRHPEVSPSLSFYTQLSLPNMKSYSCHASETTRNGSNDSEFVRIYQRNNQATEKGVLEQNGHGL